MIPESKFINWITIAHRLYPNSRIKEITPHFRELLPYGGINNDERFSMFLAQTAHESMYFKRFEENLNYTQEQLASTWSKYFRNARNVSERELSKFTDGKYNALHYHLKPERIANIIYANKNGNGGVSSGEGWKFRGRSIIQTTGKINYKHFTEKNGIFTEDFVEEPQLLTLPRYALGSAAFFWGSNKCNTPSDIKDVDAVTRIINKYDSVESYQNRRNLFDKIYKMVIA